MRECPYCKSNRVRMNGQRYTKNVWIAKRPLHIITFLPFENIRPPKKYHFFWGLFGISLPGLNNLQAENKFLKSIGIFEDNKRVFDLYSQIFKLLLQIIGVINITGTSVS